MMQKKICMYGLLSAFLCCGTALAQQQQHTVEVIPFGDMDLSLIHISEPTRPY